ncbi:MAG: RNA 3'-terminal phosphate cyclase [bacterium]|nr:RNA 3'-terminal phosphate cyclase [bacterium]
MIKLDGSQGEGGGQILRTALALSTLTQQPFEICNIRKGRNIAGLKNQHMYCINALEMLCSAKSEGASVGSECVKFEPGKIEGKTISVNMETAGSITLFFQSVLLPAMFADTKTRFKIVGGTDVNWSQPFDYFNEVFAPQLRRYADIDVELHKRGYFPKGGGKVEVKVTPKYKLSDFDNFNDFRGFLKQEAPKINLTKQHKLMMIKGISNATLDLQKAEVSERQAHASKIKLSALECPVRIRTEYSDSLSTGSEITLWSVFSRKEDDIDMDNPIILGADSLGERSKRAEAVGEEAASRLLQEINSKAAVDKHLADQLIPLMALIGSSAIKTSHITGHCRTNIQITEQFLGKSFSIDDTDKIISTS